VQDETRELHAAAADAALVHPPVLPLADQHPAEVQRPLARHAHGQRVVMPLGLLPADGEVLRRGRHGARSDRAHRPVAALVDDVFREAHFDTEEMLSEGVVVCW